MDIQRHAHLPGMRSSRGLTIVELMVGLTIGLIVVAAGMMVYSSNLVTSKAVAEQNALEENARYLTKLAQMNFSGAGYFGCQSRGGQMTNLIASNTGLLYNFASPLYAYESNGSSWAAPAGVTALDTQLSSSTPAPLVSLGSDVLAIRTAVGPILPLDVSQPLPGAANDIYVIPNNYIGTLTQNAPAMITNCSHATAFINTNTTACTQAASTCRLSHAAAGSPSPGNSAAGLAFNFGADAEVVVPATVSFYVSTAQRCALSNGGGGLCPSYSLYRKVGSNAPEELAENVQAMKVNFLYDSGSGLSSGDKQYSPANVPNWSSVVGINVDFLLKSAKPVLPQSQSTTFNSVTYTDNYVRKIVTVRVALRNALQ